MEMLDTLQAEAFDAELIKARRPSYIDSSPFAKSSSAIMPEPKIWQRTSRKRYAPVATDTETSHQTDAHNDGVPIGPSGEYNPTDMDEWSREFFFLVGIKEQ